MQRHSRIFFTTLVLFINPCSNRISDLKGIPGSSMEVVIFQVEGEACDRPGDSSIVGSSTRSSCVEYKGGPISICLWTPVKRERKRVVGECFRCDECEIIRLNV